MSVGLDTVELVMAIEDHFDLEIPNEAAEHIQTVGDMTDYLTRRLLEDGRPTVRDVVYEQVCRITCEQAGTTMDKLTPSTSFIHDLGMD